MNALDVLRVLYFFVPAYAANMTPVFVRGHLGWLDVPMDFGARVGGIRVFGDHKTWRGLLCGTVAGMVVFELQRAAHAAGWLSSLALLDYAEAPASLGFLLGLGTGLGDAVKSFFKRRVGIPPGGTWFGFDQLDFMVGAYLCAAAVYAPPLVPFLVSLPLVLVGTVATTATGYQLGLKESWI